MPLNISADVRALLDSHLDAVESSLSAAGNRETRKAITEDLQAQIFEMLAESSSNPTVEDLEEILARIDPPASYASGRAVLSLQRARKAEDKSTPDWARVFGVICLAVCGLVLLLWPSIHGLLADRAAAAIFLANPNTTSVNFENSTLSEAAKLGFWISGTLALLITGNVLLKWKSARN